MNSKKLVVLISAVVIVVCMLVLIGRNTKESYVQKTDIASDETVKETIDETVTETKNLSYDEISIPILDEKIDFTKPDNASDLVAMKMLLSSEDDTMPVYSYGEVIRMCGKDNYSEIIIGANVYKVSVNLQPVRDVMIYVKDMNVDGRDDYIIETSALLYGGSSSDVVVVISKKDVTYEVNSLSDINKVNDCQLELMDYFKAKITDDRYKINQVCKLNNWTAGLLCEENIYHETGILLLKKNLKVIAGKGTALIYEMDGIVYLDYRVPILYEEDEIGVYYQFCNKIVNGAITVANMQIIN